MQSNLNQFLGLSDIESDDSVENFFPDQLQQGKHYWTGVKSVAQLSEPGKSDYDIYDDILTLQKSKEYAHVAEDTNLEYIFDPDKFGMKDPTLVTENYELDTEQLLAYGRLATKLRLHITEKSELLFTQYQQNQAESDEVMDEPREIKQLPRKHSCAA